MLSRQSANYLLQSVLVNGELSVPTIRNHSELVQLADELSNDVLEGVIPHCKVIGARITVGNHQHLSDFVSKPATVNKSYAELLNVFDDLVWEDIDGIPPVELSNCRLPVGFLIGIDQDIKSDNGSLLYEGRGTSIMPKCMNKGVDIIQLYKNDSNLRLIVARGSGTHDFSDVNYMLYKSGYVPYRQVYNLSTTFTVRMVEPNDSNIKFCYKQDIDERVLHNILLEYAKEVLSREE